jgi:hypothetical protein
MVRETPDDMHQAPPDCVPSPDVPIPQPELDNLLLAMHNGFSRAMYQLQTGQDAAFVVTMVTLMGTYARTGRGSETMAKFLTSPLYKPENIP